MTEAPDVDRPPRDMMQAMLRGFSERCPTCGKGRLFGKYLKVRDACPACGEALHHHRADDAPAYFTMLIVGHFIVGGVLALEKGLAPPTWVHLAIWLPLTLLASLLAPAARQGCPRRPAVGALHARLRLALPQRRSRRCRVSAGDRASRRCGQSSKQVDRARPHAVAVLLLDADVEPRVAGGPQLDPAPQRQAPLAHGLGQPLQPTARSRPPASNTRGSTPSSAIAASPDTRRGLERQPPAARRLQPQIDGAIVAGRHRLPGQRGRVLRSGCRDRGSSC